MINGLEGIPGSGKSYEAVVYHVLPMLQAGRKVITNLPLLVEMFAAIDPAFVPLIELRRRPKPVMGTWDADSMDDSGNGNAFKLFPDAESHYKPTESVTVFGHVWDYYSTWKHPETGQGPVIIIDECHLALPAVGTDKQVVEFFKLHRHFNVDILLMTQSFRDINQPIARLMAMLIKCRKADILGKKNEYIRKVHAGYRGAVISTETRPYKAQYFPLYKSHTQGNSVAESAASDVAPLSVKLRRWTWGFWIFTAVVIAWLYWPKDKVQKTSDMEWHKEMTANPRYTPMQHPYTIEPASAPAKGAPPAPKPAIEAQAASAPEFTRDNPEPTPDPYASKGLHLTGRMTMHGTTVYTFAVSASGQRISTVDSRDLEAIGYHWQPMTDCAGVLRWNGKAQPITCDAPMLAQGAQDRPVVIEAGHTTSTTTPSGHTQRGPIETVPFPEPQLQQPGQITQADLTHALRLRNPQYSGLPRSGS